MKPRVVIRADASRDLGTGHVMRCLALAQQFSPQGVEVQFVSRAAAGDARRLVEAEGYSVFTLPGVEIPPHRSVLEAVHAEAHTDAEFTLGVVQKGERVADWVVVDHYALDARWERVVGTSGARVLAIDDLANRPHQCEVLVDGNLRSDGGSAYRSLLPPGATILVGPQYALLRGEFAAARNAITRTSGPGQRVLVSFGGADPTGETLKTIRALSRERVPLVDVIVGYANPNSIEIRAATASHQGWTCHVQTREMAKFMSGAALAVGAGGSSTWERCCMGLPAVIVVVAGNQEDAARESSRAGAALHLGLSESVAEEDIGAAVTGLLAQPAKLAAMSKAASALCDGMGARRVAEVMFESERAVTMGA